MTVFFAGSGPYQFETPFNSGVALSTSGVDGAWVSTSLYVANTGNTGRTIPFEEVNDGWFHWESNLGGTRSHSRYLWAGYDAANVMRARINAQVCQIFIGGVWTTIGSLPTFGGRHQFDVYIKEDDTNGEAQFYYDKELVGTYTGDTTGLKIASMLFGMPWSFGSDVSYHSQILVADFPTLFAKVKQTLFTADGFHLDWTGTVLDIDEAIPNTSDFIFTPTAGAKESWKAAARDFTGYEVKAVMSMFSGNRGGNTAPSQVRTFLRIDGVDYPGTAETLTFGNQYFTEQWLVNPATGLFWQPGEAGDADLEVGVEAL